MGGVGVETGAEHACSSRADVARRAPPFQPQARACGTCVCMLRGVHPVEMELGRCRFAFHRDRAVRGVHDRAQRLRAHTPHSANREVALSPARKARRACGTLLFKSGAHIHGSRCGAAAESCRNHVVNKVKNAPLGARTAGQSTKQGRAGLGWVWRGVVWHHRRCGC